MSATHNNKSCSFSKRHECLTTNHAGNRTPSIKDQYNKIVSLKRQLNIQIEHQEKLKKISKNPADIRNIDCKLLELRKNFLNVCVDNF
ncbi:ac29 [Artaxa digramma nucleopolyhedrovirus]|uniref:Ac29 n=1 Tax=Artaxa digramma nucleopolyhedrovirus TaxID=3070910 RepID=A0AAE6UZK8_9ABAC|nr:ac29 [Euproctis digramma nucleopolyhedrovirus]QHB21713.1 ac29 [Artaxa digramma nucleopolyhedrovirus]